MMTQPPITNQAGSPFNPSIKSPSGLPLTKHPFGVILYSEMVDKVEDKDASKEKSVAEEQQAAKEKEAADKEEVEEKETSDGSEDTDTKTSDKDVFDVGYGKGAAKKQKELLKRLGLKDDAELDAFVKARAEAAAEEAKKSGNGELHARIKQLEGENERLTAYFETEWEKVGKELMKADKDYYATVEGAEIPAKEKLRLANAALKLVTKNRKKVVDDPLNPDTKKKWTKGYPEWQAKNFPGTPPNSKDEAIFKGINRIEK